MRAQFPPWLHGVLPRRWQIPPQLLGAPKSWIYLTTGPLVRWKFHLPSPSSLASGQRARRCSWSQERACRQESGQVDTSVTRFDDRTLGGSPQAAGFQALATLLPVPTWSVSWPQSLPRDRRLPLVLQVEADLALQSLPYACLTLARVVFAHWLSVFFLLRAPDHCRHVPCGPVAADIATSWSACQEQETFPSNARKRLLIWGSHRSSQPP